MQPAIILAIYALAVTRLTGLIVADDITAPARDAVLRRLDMDRTGHRMLADLIACPWCVGMWLSLAAAPLIWLWGDQPWLYLPALAGALSQCAGMLAPLGRS